MLELNVSTILLQMANFLVLAFVLNLFLFKPVQNILKKRELMVTREMDEAKLAQQEAEKTRQIFEEKVNNIDAEVSAKTNEARIVIERTRQQMLQEVHSKVQQLKMQAEEMLSQMQTQAIQQHKEKLGDLAADFAQGILSGVMTPQLKSTFNEEFLNRVFALDLAPHIKEHVTDEKPTAQLILPQPLENSERKRLESAINQNAGTQVAFSYEINPKLLAGGILRFENELIDGSLLGQINRFKQQYQDMP
jgi:F-type H+-transporting ATPase subunit b